MTRVKICGITNIEDALAAVEAGADMLGFVFADSPRRVDVETAKRIAADLPPSISAVAVFAGQSREEVCDVMQSAGLSIAQIHGDISLPEEDVRWQIIRALRVKTDSDVRSTPDDPLFGSSWAVLLDAHVEGLMGGTGKTFDWDLAVQAKSLGKPIILAGGLTPGNVEEAIRKVRPYAVDVSTGVEASPGRKDHPKLKEFIQNAKRAG